MAESDELHEVLTGWPGLDVLQVRDKGGRIWAQLLDRTCCPKSPDDRHCVHWYDDPDATCCYEVTDPVAPVMLRLGRSHDDIVYRQVGDQPDPNIDPRVAVFTGPDAARNAAAYVALVNGQSHG